MHAYGWGVQRNPADAITWYRKAADQGLGVAQHFLGIAYVNGEGVRPDDAEAARWFARAAAQGFAQAQFMLGLMTLDGRGVPNYAFGSNPPLHRWRSYRLARHGAVGHGALDGLRSG